MGAYCEWHGKRLQDITEHEQEECWEAGRVCMDCPEMTLEPEEDYFEECG